MALRKPRIPLATIETMLDVAMPSYRVLDEAVAGEEATIGGYPKIACAGAARIGAVRTAMDLMQCLHHVGEWIPTSCYGFRLELLTARDHFLQHRFEIGRAHL